MVGIMQLLGILTSLQAVAGWSCERALSPSFEERPMVESFLGEDAWTQLFRLRLPVVYLPDPVKMAFRVHFREGVMVTESGNPAGGRFTSSGIFILSPAGETFFLPAIFTHVPFLRIRHSSLSSGEPVAAAGAMVVRQGKVISVNNQSGHYRPGVFHTMQFLAHLKTVGVTRPPTVSFLVHEYIDSGLEKHSTVVRFWENDARSRIEILEDGTLVASFEHFADFERSKHPFIANELIDPLRQAWTAFLEFR